MKLEMNRAWNDAMALIGANKDVVFIVAGVFFFLPYFAFMLMMPDMSAAVTEQAAEEQFQRLSEFYGRVWWVVLLLSLIQGVGMLGILALLTDHRRPTVGEALKIGARKVVPYIVAYILLALGMGLIATVLVGATAASGSTAAVGLGIVVLIPLLAYAFTKFSLVPPVLVKEDVSNPITALGRSWKLTKGNSFRLFGFYCLLGLALAVVMIVISLTVTFVFAMLGDEAMIFGNGLVSSLMNAVWATAFLAVLSAVHDQLGGTSSAQISETFE